VDLTPVLYGIYLATSKDIQGLVAQGRTATEALEIARDVARKLIEAQAERSGNVNLTTIDDSFDYPLKEADIAPNKFLKK
jgi:predicted RNase H-like HicB family nuclease